MASHRKSTSWTDDRIIDPYLGVWPRELPSRNLTRVNLHIVCQVNLQSVDLYTKYLSYLLIPNDLYGHR